MFFKNIDAPYYAIAIAISLTWTRHAKYDVEFVDYAAKYIDGGAKNLLMVNKYALRFGPESLDNALYKYRNVYNKINNLVIDFDSCEINSNHRLKERLLSKVAEFRKSGEVTAIGPWLFSGSFKIILSDQDRFWTNNLINAVIIPTDLEVDKAIRRLENEGYHFMRDFQGHFLDVDSGDLIDNFSTYAIIHNQIAKTGEYRNTPALHINSGLYIYGREEEELY